MGNYILCHFRSESDPCYFTYELPLIKFLENLFFLIKSGTIFELPAMCPLVESSDKTENMKVIS